jgi:hypothetical protein
MSGKERRVVGMVGKYQGFIRAEFLREDSHLSMNAWVDVSKV